MIQIEDVVVSFDVIREKFLCDLDACKGICCIEGDAGAPVELDEAGYVKAGEDCRTNVPGLFAAGDCRAKSVRQLTTAAADGTVAAVAACAWADAHPAQ